MYSIFQRLHDGASTTNITKGPFYYHGLTLIPASIHYNVWGEIIYPFPNFNGPTFEV